MGCPLSKEEAPALSEADTESQVPHAAHPPASKSKSFSNLEELMESDEVPEYLPTTGPLTAKEYKSRQTATETQSLTFPVTGVTMRFASVTQRGFYPDAPTKANQDASCMVSRFGGESEQAFFAVFDGHGEYGTQCAQYARDKVPENLLSNPQFLVSPEVAYLRAMVQTNAQLHSLQDIDDSMSGTTAITALLRGRTLYVANVGDSRCVLAEQHGDKLVAQDLSFDQTPFRRDECERVKRCGAHVMTLDQLEGLKDPNVELWGTEEENDGDPPRLWAPNCTYPGTAFTRSIGDSTAERIGVCAEPEVMVKQLNSSHPFLVIASDGVWEFLSSQSVVDMVSKFDDPQEACLSVVAESYRLWLNHETRTDDITMIVVQFQGLKEEAPKMALPTPLGANLDFTTRPLPMSMSRRQYSLQRRFGMQLAPIEPVIPQDPIPAMPLPRPSNMALQVPGGGSGSLSRISSRRMMPQQASSKNEGLSLGADLTGGAGAGHTNAAYFRQYSGDVGGGGGANFFHRQYSGLTSGEYSPYTTGGSLARLPPPLEAANRSAEAAQPGRMSGGRTSTGIPEQAPVALTSGGLPSAAQWLGLPPPAGAHTAPNSGSLFTLGASPARPRLSGAGTPLLSPHASASAPPTPAQRQFLDAALRSHFLFSWLTPEQRDSVLARFERCSVLAGETLICQGEPSDHFFVVESGEFEVWVHQGSRRASVRGSGNGATPGLSRAMTCASTKMLSPAPVVQAQHIHTYVTFWDPSECEADAVGAAERPAPADEGAPKGIAFFGELALLYPKPRAASVVARNEGVVYALSRTAFRQAVQHLFAGMPISAAALPPEPSPTGGISASRTPGAVSAAGSTPLSRPGMAAAAAAAASVSSTTPSGKKALPALSLPETPASTAPAAAEGTSPASDPSSKAFKAPAATAAPALAVAAVGEHGGVVTGHGVATAGLKGVVQALRSLEVLQCLGLGQLYKLAAVMEQVTYQDGEFITHQGEEGSEFYLLQSGEVVCSVRKNPDDLSETPREVLRLSAGQYFGERALLTAAPRAANVVAQDVVTVYRLCRVQLERVLNGSLQGVKNAEARWKDSLVLQREVLGRKSTAVGKLVQGNFSLDELKACGLLYSTDCSALMLMEHSGSEEVFTVRVVSVADVVALGKQALVLRARDITRSLEPSFFVPGVQYCFKDTRVVAEVLMTEGFCTLEALLMHHPLDEASAAFMAAGVVLALEHLHWSGVVYRGLSKHTTIVTETGQVQLVDFRFARRDEGRAYTVCGHPEYLAPEMILGKSHGEAVDLWALGVLLHYMLSGRTPFAGAVDELRMYEAITQHGMSPLEMPSHISPLAADLINGLLNPDPDARLGSGPLGLETLRAHPWFAAQHVDWEALLDHSCCPPPGVRERIYNFEGVTYTDFDPKPCEADTVWTNAF